MGAPHIAAAACAAGPALVLSGTLAMGGTGEGCARCAAVSVEGCQAALWSTAGATPCVCPARAACREEMPADFEQGDEYGLGPRKDLQVCGVRVLEGW